MEEMCSRTAMLIEKTGVEKLKNSRVGIFGIGGVGSYVAEALARASVGELYLFDKDVIDSTNINRQIHADLETVGRYKTQIMKERIQRINPSASVYAVNECILPQNVDLYMDKDFDYVIDAVDMVTAKIALVIAAYERKTNIISCMGTGNKLHPEYFELADIYETKVCPLAKVMRKELKARSIPALKVCYSKEQPVTNCRPPGSISFVPPVAGFIIAGQVVRDLIADGS